MRLAVRKKRKKTVEEKIKSNQMKILQQMRTMRMESYRTDCNQSSGWPRDDGARDSGKMIEVKRRQVTRLEEMNLRPARSRPQVWPSLWLVALAILQTAASQCRASTLSDFDGATFYKAPVGSRIRIACNASHWNDDSISLVLWFKGNPAANSGAQLQPIYTIDARQKPLSSGQARHLVADAYKGRARFVFPEPLAPLARTASSGGNSNSNSNNSTAQVPFLDLAPIEADDQGEYRCRVDYRSRPRENFLIILFVLVPPSSVEITDSSGRALEQIYGPLNEGSELRLVCLSKGGRPPPAIVWRRAGHVIDDSYLTLNDFLTLKLANASAANQFRRRDNDPGLDPAPADNQTTSRTRQRQELPQSDSAGQLAAADWLAWPEFNYFHSQAGGQQVATPLLTPRQYTKQAPSPSQQQLIDWQVDGATVTGVNVLHLSELTRAHLTEDQPQPEEAARRPGDAASPLAPKLECHASNLHYDLHSLIKLFAPPSLQATNDESDADRNNNTAQQLQLRATGRNSTPAPSQGAAPVLSQAIERAIWANVRAASSQPGESNEVRQTPANARVAHLHRQQQSQPQQPEDAPPPSTVAELNWPLVIEQQLIRPHKLVAASLPSAAEDKGGGLESAPSSEQAAGSKSPATSPSHLSRSRLIALEANLRPLDVRITSPSRALAAGQVHEFTCQSRGSWPAARLSWLKDGRRLGSSQQQPSATRRTAIPDGDTSPALGETYKLSAASVTNAGPAWPASSLISQSKLTIKLEREDHNARISCRAENEHFKRSTTARRDQHNNHSLVAAATSDEVVLVGAGSQNQDEERNWQLEDSVTLDVHYGPQVRLELGTKMLSERIRENQDIYFVCRCDANPAVTEITWLHNDRPLNESRGEPDAQGGGARAHINKLRLAAGDGGTGKRPPQTPGGNHKTPANLIVSNDSLVLQRVQIEQSGQYSCLASNSEGVGLSNQIELRVLHAPICVASHGGRAETFDGASGQKGGPLALSLGSFPLATVPGVGGRSIGGTGEHLPAPLRLACQMLVPHEDDQQTPAGDNQLEFSWYLNNTFNERRLLARQTSRDGDVKLIDAPASELLGLPWRAAPPPSAGPNWWSSGGPSTGAAHHQRKSAASTLRLAVAHLNLSWEQATLGLGDASLATGAQIGQLFCLARNALGEQRRACHYSIEAGEPRWSRTEGTDYDNNDNRNGHPPDQATTARFSCLFVNVTANSAWIGCDSWTGGRRHSLAQSANKLQLEITQAEENNDRLRPALAGAGPNDESRNEANREFRFNVLVFSLGVAQAPDRRQVAVVAPGAPKPSEPVKQLEANLSSGPLDEALFAVVNLQPNTKYLLEIDDLSRSSSSSFDQRQRETATVSLRTLAASEITKPHADSATDGQRSGGGMSRPSIRQVTEPHPPDLLAAALTSTRSNNGHQLYALDHKLQRPAAGASREQSAWASWLDALIQFVGIRSNSANDQRLGPRGRRPPPARAGDHHPIGHLVGKSDGLLALCAYVLALLLTTLVALFVFHRSRLCAGIRASGRRHRRPGSRDATKMCPGKSDTPPSVGSGRRPRDDADDNDELELDGQSVGDERKRPPSGLTSASHDSSSPPRKQGPPDTAPTTATTNPSTRGGSSALTGAGLAAPAGRIFPDHHYSTLNSHTGTQFQRQQQPPSINFLKSSSITSASATLTRAGPLQQRGHLHHNHHHRHQQQQQQQQHESPSPQPLVVGVPATDHQARLGVSRSRSSLGFRVGGCDIATNLAPNQAGEPSALLLLAQIQTASRDALDATTTGAVAPQTRQRLLQQAEATDHERAALLGDELRLQTSKGLISDANFPFALAGTTSAASTTPAAGATVTSLDGRKLRTVESAAPSDSCHLICNQTPASEAYLYGQARYGKALGLQQQQCNCDELHLELTTCAPSFSRHDKLLASSQPGACCSTQQQQQQQQSYPGFIELLPNVIDGDCFGAGQQPAIISFGHQNGPAFERTAETPNNVMLGLQQRPHYHHVVFNQSLNSSSIGSPSTNNQFGSSPLGSISNTTPSNTESFQYNNATTNNNLILVTAADGDQGESDLDCSAKQLHGHTFNANSTGNYSPENSSQATANSAQANSRPTSKQRPASILKNCGHLAGTGPPLNDSRSVQIDQSLAGCDED